MNRKPATDPWRDPELGPCACSQIRRTARALSVLYDEFLESSGLTVTQYALLVSIGRAEQISRTSLAARLGMERTTLTRNLRPLERENLVGEKTGEDRRERVLALTPRGRKQLTRSYPLWEQAQCAFFTQFGRERFDELRTLLAGAAEASKAAGLAATAAPAAYRSRRSY